MLSNSLEYYQRNLFYTDFMMQLDTSDSLLQLDRKIPWHEFEKTCNRFSLLPKAVLLNLCSEF